MVFVTPEGDREGLFKEAQFYRKTIKWMSFGNDLMNRKLTGLPLKTSFVIY